MRDKLLAGELRLGGEVRQASVLFCDLRGFTGLAETAPPAAADRHEYTVIGDTVNVAARLLQVCKERGCRILLSAYTYELARAHGVAVNFTVRDSVSLRGRNETVRVLGVV